MISKILQQILDRRDFSLPNFIIQNRLSAGHKCHVHCTQRIQEIVHTAILLYVRKIQSCCLRIYSLSLKQSLIQLSRVLFRNLLQIFVLAYNFQFSYTIRESKTLLQGKQFLKDRRLISQIKQIESIH